MVSDDKLSAKLRLGPEISTSEEKENVPTLHMLVSKEIEEQECFSTGIARNAVTLINVLPVNLQPLGDISPQNTTIITDKYGSCFENPDSKWLVQKFDKAVIQTIINRVISGEITVARRYIFLMIGGNQVFRAKKTLVHNKLNMLTLCVLGKNPVAKIFVAGVLPRPVKDHYAKDYIRDFNRFLCAAVKKIQKQYTRIFYVPAQLQFQARHEYNCLFESNLLQLSVFGKMQLKRALLEGAGFIAK